MFRRFGAYVATKVGKINPVTHHSSKMYLSLSSKKGTPAFRRDIGDPPPFCQMCSEPDPHPNPAIFDL
jgi:hypothetical protein